MPTLAELKKITRHRQTGFMKIEPSLWKKIYRVLNASCNLVSSIYVDPPRDEDLRKQYEYLKETLEKLENDATFCSSANVTQLP
jgi:hypothetical protein